MAKRLHDTDIWKKQWFRELSPAEKCIWFFIKDQCDMAGVYEIDIPLAEFLIGAKVSSFEVFDRHIKILSDKKIWLVDFIEFQYGLPLNEKSPVHKKAIHLLKKHKIHNRVLNTLLNRVLDTAKEEEEEEEENKDKKEDKNLLEFNLARTIYPGTKRGNQTEFDNLKNKHKDWKRILPLLRDAIKKQIDRRKLAPKNKFIPEWKNFSTWINQRCWEEEIEDVKSNEPLAPYHRAL